MSTRSLASRLLSGSSNRTRGCAPGAAHRDALALAAGQLARLAIQEMTDLHLAMPATACLLGLGNAAHLHAEGDLPDRHVGIERAGPEHHGTSRREGCRLLTARPLMRISPPVMLSSPAMLLSSVDLPQPDGPTSTRNPPSSTEVDAQHVDRAEALLQIVDLEECHGSINPSRAGHQAAHEIAGRDDGTISVAAPPGSHRRNVLYSFTPVDDDTRLLSDRHRLRPTSENDAPNRKSFQMLVNCQIPSP
jgi:hypothetical protein